MILYKLSTAFNLDFFTEVLDLNYLLEMVGDDPLLKKFKKMNEAIIGVIQDYSLVSFTTLNIQVKIDIGSCVIYQNYV